MFRPRGAERYAAKEFMTAWILTLIFVTIFLCIKSVKILPDHMRGVVYRLGRLDSRVRGPGFVFLIPYVDEMKLVVTRPEVMIIPEQSALTNDGKSLRMGARVHVQVKDPIKTRNVMDPHAALLQLAPTVIRAEISKVNFDEFARGQEAFNRKLRDILQHSVRDWGLEVSEAEIKDLIVA